MSFFGNEDVVVSIDDDTCFWNKFFGKLCDFLSQLVICAAFFQEGCQIVTVSTFDEFIPEGMDCLS